MKTGLGWQSISISCPWRRLRDMMSDRVFMGLMELRHSERESALQSVLWKQQMWSSFCITEEKENPMQSCRFRSITGSEGFIPCLFSDWISMILNMHIE